RADVRAVHVRIGHDDDAVIPQLRAIEVLVADAAAERGNHGLDLVAGEHFFEARLLDVQDLALDRKNRLESPVAALLRRPAGRLTFDDVELAQGGVAFLTISQLSRQAAAVEGPLSTHEVPRLSGSLPCARS